MKLLQGDVVECIVFPLNYTYNINIFFFISDWIHNAFPVKNIKVVPQIK